LPFADLKPGQTRHLPTRLVSLNAPDAEAGVKLPEKGEPLRLGDIGRINDNPRAQKAMRRLAAEKAATTVSQLVMWNVAAGLDWDTIAESSRNWANRSELALARDFVDRLDADPPADGEAGRLLLQIDGTDEATAARASGLKKALEGRIVLGLRAGMGIPEQPAGPALACRVQFKAQVAQVELSSSDASGRSWVAVGKFSLPVADASDEAAMARLADAMAEGLLNRVVRAEIVKGPRVKGRLTYRLRIENASPLALNGVAMVGTASRTDREPHVLAGISIPPRRSLTAPASEEVVKALDLRHGICVTAADLSGL
jgi:hypothetical protein